MHLPQSLATPGVSCNEKATQEAGPLSDQARTCMSENIELQTEAPALRLKDDETLVGGLKNGEDCLANQQKLKSDLPDVLVGPGSTPFTSGSEGKPKGVKVDTSP